MCQYERNLDEVNVFEVWEAKQGEQIESMMPHINFFSQSFIEGEWQHFFYLDKAIHCMNLLGGSPITLNDQWTVYLVYKAPSAQNRVFVGFLTLFLFTQPLRFSCPNSLRICQIVVLPPFQRQGPP